MMSNPGNFDLVLDRKFIHVIKRAFTDGEHPIGPVPHDPDLHLRIVNLHDRPEFIFDTRLVGKPIAFLKRNECGFVAPRKWLVSFHHFVFRDDRKQGEVTCDREYKARDDPKDG